MIPQSFIQDLLGRVDIVEVVGRYVKLKKGGANFMGLCPFHNEKSPSFTVSPTKQFYHCFGCGAHGTAVGFLMEYSGQSFPDAVRDLAQASGMTVPEEDNRITPELRQQYQAQHMALTEVLMRATDYYRQQLRGAPRAIEYLKGRGLTGEIAARFGLGYSPSGWQNLAAAFDDYQMPALLEAGLVIEKGGDEGGAQGDEGAHESTPRRRYDRFRDRIMFPIRNTKGQVIGFGGRVIAIGDEKPGEPKYLNSPETPVFQKGNELYGLFEARQGIREAGHAIVVEGYMDVVALAQLGVPNAVATLGTACGATHVQKLLRQTDHIVFSFDGDGAGRRAAWRALEASLPFAADNKQLAFLFLPPEHDPDSFIREYGREAFEGEVKAALPLSAFIAREMSETHDLGTAEGRAKAQYDVKPLLRALPAGALRMQIVRELARLTQSAPEELAEFAELAAAEPARAQRRYAPPRGKRSAPAPLEAKVLQILMNFPQLAQNLESGERELLLGLDSLDGFAVQELFNACAGAGTQGGSAGVSEVLSRGPAGEFFTDLIRQLIQAPSSIVEVEEAERELHGALVALRMRSIEIELKRLADGGLADTVQADRYRHLTQEKNRLRVALGVKGASAT